MRLFFHKSVFSQFILLFILSSLLLCEGSSKLTDANILLQFKQSRLDSSFLSSWDLSVNSDICKGWKGVTCSKGRVSVLKLQDAAMGGGIPSELGGLDQLIGLRLSNLSLSGPIPPEIGNLRNISTGINFASNALNGSIPKELGNLSKITTLRLEFNQLTGELPDSLSNCILMEDFQLYNNNLTSKLPKWLGDFQNLVILRFQSNNFYGPIPAEISNLANLQHLQLGSNNLTGTIPVGLSSLYSLTFGLDLSFNYLTGSLPPDPMYFDLEKFDLSHNQLTGAIPEGYTSFPVVTDYSLNNNKFSGSLPKTWDMASVGTIKLNDNKLSGSIPSSLIGMSNLLLLDLNGNSFSGSIPKAVKSAASLLELRLQNNRLSGNIPTELSNLKNLSVLLLNQNDFNGSIPASLSECSALTQLDLSNNSLEGVIPPKLASLNNLLSFIVANNKLQGPLPVELKSITSLTVLNVSGNALSDSISPSLFTNSSKFRDIILNNNAFNGSIPSTLGLLPDILHIQLNFNQLSGVIPSELSNLTKLETLLLQNNQLEGEIPSSFSNLNALSSFNVSNNRLEGRIPSGTLQSLNMSSFANNSNLCGSPFLPLCKGDESSKDSKLSTGAVVAIILCSLFVTFLFLSILLFFLLARRRKSSNMSFTYVDPGDGDFTLFQKLGCPLTYMDILKSTNHFNDDKKLGAGGFGTVYSAVLPDGETTVAIKRLSQSSRQGIKELQAEVNTLGQIHHRNLVTLIGSYMSDTSGEALLIYSFVSGGSLDGLLFKSTPIFRPWSVRLNVLIGSARGLKYLHHDSTPCIIHRDIKPANILLDENMEAHVADFGLAKVLDVSRTHLSTAVSGTVGYMSPEYAQKGKLTTKSDVFSFGVVILQVVTGKKPTDPIFANKGLSKWISDHWVRSAATEVFDPEMEYLESEEGQVLGALKLGLLCTSKSPSERPSMAEVVNILENLDSYSSGMMSNA